jgi:hypothetical protein
MTVLVTDWKGRMNPLDVLVTIDGEEIPVPVMYGTTTPVFVDMEALLDEGETITQSEVAVVVRRLPAKGESDYADAANTISGPPVVQGSVISQKLQSLERGRVYRMEVIFGPAGNRRGAPILVQCPE